MVGHGAESNDWVHTLKLGVSGWQQLLHHQNKKQLPLSKLGTMYEKPTYKGSNSFVHFNNNPLVTWNLPVHGMVGFSEEYMSIPFIM